jgi:hypothetical protein
VTRSLAGTVGLPVGLIAMLVLYVLIVRRGRDEAAHVPAVPSHMSRA